MPIYKSPSTSVRDVDIKSAEVKPSGIPAVIVGTSRRGPAFVPVTVGSFDSFITNFGDVDTERFGPLAMQRWLTEGGSRAGSYIRLLGAGDCKRRTRTGENAGKVNHAGFVVGAEQIQENGMIGPNPFAGSHGDLGRTYVLGSFMSESNSTIFSDAGLQEQGKNKSVPIIRGILFAASGVHLSLNTEAAINNEPSTTAKGLYGPSNDAGLSFGDILVSDGHESNFIVILNGHTGTEEYPNAITASFIPGLNPLEGVKSIKHAFNTDPYKLEQAGHLLKHHYDISEKFAVCTGSQLTSHRDSTWAGTKTDGFNYKLYQTAFLLTSSLERNKGSSTTSTSIGVPNFENFENRFTNAFTPFVTSQKIDGKYRDLFRFYTLDSGYSGFGNYKVTISNITPKAPASLSNYATFDVHIRSLNQSDSNFTEVGISGESDLVGNSLESYIGVDLDPSSDNFISKRIGDKHTFYDFDKSHRDAQKIVVDGNYANVSNLVRVSVADEVANASINANALPFGFRGLYHMVTSGSTDTRSILTGTSDLAGSSLPTKSGITSETLKQINQPPAPFRESLFTLNDSGNPVISSIPTWGFQIEEKLSPQDPNKLDNFATASMSYLDYMPDFHSDYQNLWVGDNPGASDIGGSVLDSDRYHNNFFSLDKIEVLTSSAGSSKGFPDPNEWSSSRYRRNGKPSTILKKSSPLDSGVSIFENSRMIKVDDLTYGNSRIHLSFTLPFQGGFDGTNIFNKDKCLFSNNAVIREFLDSSQNGRNGTTISAYKTVMKILEDKKTHPGNLLIVPGIRSDQLTGEFLETCSNRFDMFYIKDIEEKGHLNQEMTGSEMGPFASTTEEANSVTDAVANVRTNFAQQSHDNSFGAAYYPDILIKVPTSTGIDQQVQVPPSVVVAGVYSSLLNESVKPLGTIRGKVKSTDIESIKLTDEEIDDFFEAGINVIATDPNLPKAGPFIRSQKTLKNDGREMSNISVRRMLIQVRREVGKLIRERFLFDQITQTNLASLKLAIQSVLRNLQSSGAFKFSVVDVDGETTSQEDMNRNIIRGRILIRPHDVSETYILDVEETSGE